MPNNINNFQQDQIHISKLILDIENPRLQEIQESEAGCIKEIIKHPNKKFFNLMEDICDNGLNPGEGLYLMPGDIIGNYIVLEGNRRVCALKLLHNPNLAEGLISKTQSKKLSDLSDQFISDPIQVIQSVIFSDRLEADPWIVRKHQGENGGRGVVHWKNPEKNRHDERLNKYVSASTQYINHFIQNNTITKQEAKEISLTTLNRIVEKHILRNLLSYEYDKNKHHFSILGDGMFFDFVHAEVIKLLCQKEIKVSDVYDEAKVMDVIYNRVIPAIQDGVEPKVIEELNDHMKKNLDWVNKTIKNKPATPITFPNLGESTTNEDSGSKSSDPTGTTSKGADNSSDKTNGDNTDEQASNDGSGAQAEDDTSSGSQSGDDTSRQTGGGNSEGQTGGDDTQQTPEESDEDEENETLQKVHKDFSDMFKDLKKEIQNSQIEPELKKIIREDAKAALIAFDNGSFKTCGIMLGAVLEGIMLGLLIRQDVLGYVINNISQFTCLKLLDLKNPSVQKKREKILNEISFEQLKQFIGVIFVNSSEFNIGTIQEIRNIIHPQVALRNKRFRTIDQTRAISLISNLLIITREIINWNPPQSGQN